MSYWSIISVTLASILLLVSVANIHKGYTSVTFILLASLLLFLIWQKHTKYMGRFYFSFLVIMLPFLIVNGILTGTFIEDEVVWYNNDENLGIRLGTIPIEDVFYGMLMLLLNISIFEKLKSKKI